MKISIIGSGNVGSNAAFAMIHSNLPIKDIVLIDTNASLAEGNALDLMQACASLQKKISIKGTSNFSEVSNSDFIVITAGKPRTPEIKTRLDLLRPNVKIAQEVAEQINGKIGNATVIVVTNPMDLMTYCFYKLLKHPRDKLLGMGSSLDTARLHSVGMKGVAFGEHGDGMIFSESLTQEQSREVKSLGTKVIGLKGNTGFATAEAITKLLETLHFGGSTQVSYVFEGELGIENCSLGIPAKLGSSRLLEVESLPDTKISELRSVYAKLKDSFALVDDLLVKTAE